MPVYGAVVFNEIPQIKRHRLSRFRVVLDDLDDTRTEFTISGVVAEQLYLALKKVRWDG